MCNCGRLGCDDNTEVHRMKVVDQLRDKELKGLTSKPLNYLVQGMDPAEFFTSFMPKPRSPVDRNHRYMTQVLDTVLDIWTRFPMLRLGQLLDNAVESNRLFYMEDDRVVEKLRAFEAEHTKEMKRLVTE